MFTYKNAPYKIFALNPKFCWAGLHTPSYLKAGDGSCTNL